MKKQNKKHTKNKFSVFQSDDSEGSDLSFQSSDQGEEQAKPLDKEKGLQKFKQEMARFFISNPELKNLKLGADEQQTEPQNLWSTMTLNVLKEAKSVQQTPSIEGFTKRLNLFKNKIERYDLIDQILKEQKKLMAQIEQQIANKKKNQLSIHQRAQAKVRKQTGVLNFFSKCKKEQFQMRVEKAEEREMHRRKQRKTFKRRSQKIQKQIMKEEKSMVNIPEMDLKSEAGKILLQRIKKMDDQNAKKEIIQFLGKHRLKTKQEFKGKQSLLQQGYRYYPQDSKEFLLLYPNTGSKKKIGSTVGQDFMETKKDIEVGNTYLLQKMNKILNGSLLKHWKSLREHKI